jgi:glycosyltransferase involved in cell wall biosynthesis
VRIVQFLYSGLSGVADVAFNIIEGDRDRHFEHALIFVGVVPLLPQYEAACMQKGVPYRQVRYPGGKPWRSWRAIYRHLADLRPDALIVHGGGPSLVPATAFARLRRLPVFVVEHHPIGLRSRADWTFSRFGLATGAKFVMLTQEYQDAFEAHLGRKLAPARVRIIPNGVDTDLFRPERHSLVDGPHVRLGMAARFTPAKRFDLLVEAFNLLIAARPEVDWALSLAGDGQTLQSVRELAEQSPAQDRIEFRGMLAKDALADWYRELDLYVHAAEEETQSMALLQAMASGLPIVASNVAGIANLFAGSPHTGLLSQTQTAQGFADAISALLAAPSETARMAEQARQVCVERFSQVAMFNAYRALMEEAR